jgi:serine protease AprX
VDAGFFPHPDLVRPGNRIAAWVDASRDPIVERRFTRDDVPAWPMGAEAAQWHGLMTSTTAAGNGWLSHGLYRGLAPECQVALVQVGDRGRISNAAIVRALAWLRDHQMELTGREGRLVVSLSVAGEDDSSAREVDSAVSGLVAAGAVVVAAAGNDGVRRLLPPATSRDAITVGGLDDRNTVQRRTWEVWHSNYGEAPGYVPKPEVVAPSIWTVAPLLPGSDVAREAARLFERRQEAERRIAELRLVTPHYQHVEGTSFAAPIVAGLVACMWQANATLTPRRIRDLLMASATRIPGASEERQGAGVVDAGMAVAAALADRHSPDVDAPTIPIVDRARVRFLFHDHHARSVRVMGAWNGWRPPGLTAVEEEPGLWTAVLESPPLGKWPYKLLVNETMWMADPANPLRTVDASGNVNSLLVTG